MDEMVNDNETGTNDNFAAKPFNGTLPASKNFKASEFNCKDGTPVPAEYYGNLQTLIDNLQILRDAIGLPISINSGYRTPSHNKEVGGAPNSMHLKAGAADIVIPGMTAASVRTKIKNLITAGKMRNGGMGIYPSFTHYDIGPVRTWTK